MTREERKKERDEIKARREEARREEKKKTEEERKKQEEKLRAEAKRKKGWFQKIPAHVLLSPTGIVLVMFALTIEIIDLLIPIPIVDQIIELPLEIAFIVFFLLLVENASFKAMVIPFVLERIPILSDILPTWFLKIIM